MVIAFLALSSLHDAYTKPTLAYIINVNVNSITDKRNTLTAFSPSPFGEGRGEDVEVRMLR
jgi:hypothetical protein